MASRLRINPEAPDPASLERAARAIRTGGLVALPTDTFYALAADATSREAVRRALAAKGRHEKKTLGLLVADEGMVKRVAEGIPEHARRLMDRFWPGALSLVLPGKGTLPEGVLGPDGGVSVRVPGCPVALEVIRRAGCPVTGTSANRTGEKPARTAEEVERSLGEWLDVILDAGKTAGLRPSTLVDLRQEKPVLLREGAISWEEIASSFG